MTETQKKNEPEFDAEVIPLFRTKQDQAQLSASELDPTTETYRHLRHAYAFLNRRLFAGELPSCLIAVQRHKRAYGYFSGRRFESFDGGKITDEIALNPEHFAAPDDKDVLSTLAHEMAHLWQAHYGKSSRGGYHNREWAKKMLEIGLVPTDSGLPGGRQTGQRMTHLIQPGGIFDNAADELIEKGFVVAFVDRRLTMEPPVAVQKRLSKTHYRCECGQNAWAKPGAEFDCRRCKTQFEPVAECA